MSQLIANGAGDISPQRPPSFLPHRPPSFLPNRFQKPEIPSFSVPEVSMISDDLNTSRISKVSKTNHISYPEDVNHPKHLHGDQNFASANGSQKNVDFKSPASVRNDSIDRHLSDAGDGSVASSSGSSSSSSGKRILSPPISQRRSSHGGHATSSPMTSSITHTATPTTSSTAQASKSVFSPSSQAFVGGSSTDQSSAGQSLRGRNAVFSTSSAVPQRLVDNELTHHRARSTPAGGFQRADEASPSERMSSRIPGSSVHDGAGGGQWPREGPQFQVSRDGAICSNGSERRERRRAQQNCLPLHELLPESEQLTQEERELAGQPSQGLESRFDGGCVSGESGVNIPTNKEIVSKQSAAPNLFQQQSSARVVHPSFSTNPTSQHQTPSDEIVKPNRELRHSQSEGDIGSFPKPEIRHRVAEVHPVVLEMLRMQEANIRLLQEQVMYLMRRRSEGSCCCDRRSSGILRRCGGDAAEDDRLGSRRCGGDAAEDDRLHPNFRDVGTNARTSFYLENDENGGKTIDVSSKTDLDRRRTTSTIPDDEADRQSSASRSGKSTPNQMSSSESPSTQSSGRSSSRPSAKPSRTASSSSSSRSRRSGKEEEPRQTTPPGKSKSPSTPERPSASPNASPTTTAKVSPTSRGDFSQLSSPRFGESATMILEECGKIGEPADGGPSLSSPQASLDQSTGKCKPQNCVNSRRISSLSAPEAMSPSQERNSPVDDPTDAHERDSSDDIDKLSKMSPRRSISRNSYNNEPCSAENISMYLPKINYVTLMLGRETEASENMESLALKYLKDDELAELAGLSPRSAEKTAVKPCDRLEDRIVAVRKDSDNNDKENVSKNKNYSFATKKYLMKYGLINERSVSFVVPPDGKDDKESNPDNSSVPGADLLNQNADARSTSSSSSSTPSRRSTSNMVLDLHKIQHLPKLT